MKIKLKGLIRNPYICICKNIAIETFLNYLAVIVSLDTIFVHVVQPCKIH